MKSTIHWAILGPGKIALKFADAFKTTPGASLYAVASRDKTRSQEFAARFQVPKVYSTYESLLADAQVDIVYVATPHPFHFEQTLLCLKHGKAVVCEKPLSMNLAQTTAMIELARSRKVFLMEGMWSRFFPATIKAYDLIKSGAIGAVKFLQADFGFNAPYVLEGRVFNLTLGGGAQLDVGVYPLFLALLMLGKPEKVQALSHRAVTGADETTSVQMSFPGGSLAHIVSSVTADTRKQADIIGTEGTIVMHTPWHKSQSITLKKNSGESQTFDFPFSGFGFEYELAHATQCLQKGLTESALMSHELSLWMAEAADEILKQGGIVYPK